MRPAAYFLVILGSIAPAWAAKPHVTAIPGCIQITYKMESIETALPKQLIDSALADIKNGVAPKNWDVDYFTSKRTPKHVYSSPVTYSQAPGDKFRWQRNVDGGQLIIRSDGVQLARGTFAIDLGKSYRGGNMLGDVPFLGFEQPLLPYRSDNSDSVKSAGNGFVETCQVTLTGDRMFRGDETPKNVTLTYDKLGRLIRFRIADNDVWEYSHFKQLPGNGTYCPQTVVHHVLGTYKAGGKTWTVPIAEDRLKASTVSTKDIPESAFAIPRQDKSQ